MLALRIRLNCTLEEIQGTTSKESLERAAMHLKLTYWSTAIIGLASAVCAFGAIIWLIILFEQISLSILPTWQNINGWILCCFCIILVLYLFFAYFVLRAKMHEIFGKELSEEFKMLRNTFTVTLAVNLFMAAYYSAYGHFYTVICQTYIRWSVGNFLQVLF